MDRACSTCGEIGKSYRIVVVNLTGLEHFKDIPVNGKKAQRIILRQWFQNCIIMAPAEFRNILSSRC
jgi:hypothetical protein